MTTTTAPASKTRPMRVTVRIVESIGAVSAADWDECAGGDNPTVAHAFLKSMEDTTCVGGRSGWQPQHLVLEEQTEGKGKRLLGVAPMYAKSHSHGEYV